MDHIETDICVIGSGVAGGIVAKECSESGRDVVVLEAGRRVSGRPLAVRLMERALRDFRMPRMQWHRRSRYRTTEYRNVGNQSYALRGLAVNARGGSILGWIGTAYRLRPEDFRLHSATGRGVDWPISYTALETHYARAEATMRVSGDHRDEGHPPRSAPFPLPARPYHKRDEPFLDLLADRGWPPMHHNISLASDGGAFTLDELLDDLESRPNVKLLTRSPVTRIVCTSRSRAAGAECMDLDTGEPFMVQANSVVVCAGGIESPTLLQRSANEWWPTGLGDHSGHLGRHLASHAGIVLGGRPSGLRIANGPIGSTVATRHFDSEDQQGSGKYLLLWYPSASGYLFLKVTMELFPNAGNSVASGSGMTRFGTTPPIIDFNYEEQAGARVQALREQLGLLAARMGMDVSHDHGYVNAHPMCTARMSAEPQDGVIDSDLRVHEMDNVYVCGSASFSTGGAANPTLTIAALAHRLGRHLSEGAA